jgi:hypothetical protein
MSASAKNNLPIIERDFSISSSIGSVAGVFVCPSLILRALRETGAPVVTVVFYR